MSLTSYGAAESGLLRAGPRPARRPRTRIALCASAVVAAVSVAIISAADGGGGPIAPSWLVASGAAAEAPAAGAADVLASDSMVVVQGGVHASGHTPEAISPVSSEVRAERGSVPAAAAPGDSLSDAIVGPSEVEEQDDRMEGPSSSGADARASSPDGGPTAGIGPADDDGGASGVKKFELGVRVYDAQYGALRTSAYPWEHVAPAYRPVRFDAQVGDDLTAGPVKFSWDVVAHAKSADDDAGVGETETANLLGQNQTYIFRGPGTTYTLRLTAEFENEVRSATRFAVMCKYVRREVRDMSHADREAFFTALEIAHRADNIQQGRDTYGPRFTSVAALVAKHLDATTLNACSPFFNGLSFVTSHAALALELEQVLQTIDPSIALPYWDYTQDAAEYGGGGDWRTGSDLFQDEWFGEAAPGNSDHHVQSGRFAYLPIASVGDQFSLAANGIATPEHNAYDRLTDAFNNDPSAYLTRWSSVCSLPTQNSLPDCVALQGTLEARDMRTFAQRLERSLHGDIFTLIGGAWDCRYSALDAMRAEPAMHPQLIEAVGLKLPMLWRTMLERGPLACPTACNVSVTFEDCSCSCPAFDPIEGLWQSQVYDALENATVFDELFANGFGFLERAEDTTTATGYKYSVSGLSENEGNAFFKYLLSTLCHPGKLAPASSYHAAPNDPLFWVVHANLDRVHAWMRANPDPTSGAATFDTTWNTTGEAACGGHGYHDLLPFQNLLDEHTPHAYSNEQLQRIFHPHNPALPYVYDSFSWDHCSETVRPGLVETLSDAAGAVQTVATSSESDDDDDDDSKSSKSSDDDGKKSSKSSKSDDDDDSETSSKSSKSDDDDDDDGSKTSSKSSKSSKSVDDDDNKKSSKSSKSDDDDDDSKKSKSDDDDSSSSKSKSHKSDDDDSSSSSSKSSKSSKSDDDDSGSKSSKSSKSDDDDGSSSKSSKSSKSDDDDSSSKSYKSSKSSKSDDDDDSSSKSSKSSKSDDDDSSSSSKSSKSSKSDDDDSSSSSKSSKSSKSDDDDSGSSSKSSSKSSKSSKSDDDDDSSSKHSSSKHKSDDDDDGGSASKNSTSSSSDDGTESKSGSSTYSYDLHSRTDAFSYDYMVLAKMPPRERRRLFRRAARAGS